MYRNDISYQRDDYFGEQDRFSAGARYSGFGNTDYSKEKSHKNEYLEGALSSLSVGWSVLSKGAVQAAYMAKDGVRCLKQQQNFYLLYLYE